MLNPATKQMKNIFRTRSMAAYIADSTSTKGKKMILFMSYLQWQLLKNQNQMIHSLSPGVYNILIIIIGHVNIQRKLLYVMSTMAKHQSYKFLV